ncbi:uncharacterized protein LOC117220611 [Megalopta genalis]|uniref:uncharacterized protein LOC117220611 n=1 Tax=Megalopta genalis TaxID=115081 RepID=UPI003FD5FB4D
MRTTENAVRKAVENHLCEPVEILSITDRSFSEKGLNFLSDIEEITVKYRRTPEGKEGSVVFIVKLEPSNEFPKQMVDVQNTILVETRMLRDILPKVKQLIDHPIGPRLWYYCEDARALIMENLIEQRFVMQDRQKGLSFEHCCLVLRILAKYHAATVAIHEKNPELVEQFKGNGIVAKECIKAFFRLMEVSLLRISEQIKSWPDEKCVKAAPKIAKMAESIVNDCIEAYEYDPDEFCVVNHGDCWINNIMFKENEKGEPVDLRMVDYQLSGYSSPAIDLIYFLNTCPELSIKYDKDDYFVELYLNTLKETMKQIGCKTNAPSLKQLKASMHKRRAYAVFAGLVLKLRMIANKEDTEDFTLVLQTYGGETRMNVFKHPNAVKMAKKMIPVMDERGYFD